MEFIKRIRIAWVNATLLMFVDSSDLPDNAFDFRKMLVTTLDSLEIFVIFTFSGQKLHKYIFYK